MVSILRIEDDADIKNAVDAADAYLRTGGVIVYPTDTVYGLGCDANSRDSLANVHKIKGIAKEKSFSVMMSDLSMIGRYCDIGPEEEMALGKYLPGPYTFLLKSKGLCAASTNEKLGVRIPDSRFCQSLVEKFGRPIVTTSANRTGKNPPTRFEDIEPALLKAVELAINGGRTKYGKASTVIDLVGRKLIREGRDMMDLDELPREK